MRTLDNKDSPVRSSNSGGVRSIVEAVLRSPGQPLDAHTRSFLEPRFGHDFSRVRVMAVAPRTMRSDLDVTQPGDQLELEADRIAEKVLHGSVGSASVDWRNTSAPRSKYHFSEVQIHTGSRASEAASAVNAKAYTVGNHIVFGEGRYAPQTAEGRRLLAHELAHVGQVASNNQLARAIQRAPVFPDTSCDDGHKKKKIIADVEKALDIVKQALSALSDPDSIAGPLKRFFHIELDKPGHREILLPLVTQYLSSLQTKLEEPVKSFCVRGAEINRARGAATDDELDEEGNAISEEGIKYNRNVFTVLGFTTRAQIINTVLHEYAHLIDIGHGEAEGDPVLNKNSTKIKGWDTFQALNHAEVFMKFIRAIT